MTCRASKLSVTCALVCVPLISAADERHALPPNASTDASGWFQLAQRFDPRNVVWCNGVRYYGECPRSQVYEVPVPPPEHPDVTRARELNNLGVQAYNQKDYARAARLFNDAWILNGNSEYQKNYRDARAAVYSELASQAWREKKWDAAVKHYEQSYEFSASNTVLENITRAKAYRADDWASRYFEEGDYDRAIVFWEEANRIWPQDSYVRNVRAAKIRKTSSAAGKALADKRYADAEAAADNLLAMDPDSKYGWRIRADARLQQAKQWTGGDFQVALQNFQRAMEAYAALAQRDNSESTSWVRYGRESAFRSLMSAARTTAERDNLVRFYTSWGGERDSAVSQISSASGRPYRGINSSDTDPVSEPAPRTASSPTTIERRRTTAAPAPTVPSITTATALARATGSAAGQADATRRSGDCFDGRNCSGSSNVDIRFTSSTQFLPPERETPVLRQLHQQISEIASKIERIDRSIEKAKDPWRKQDLERQRTTLRTEQVSKKAEYDTIAHSIPRLPGQ